jgi:hypothetical protein
MPPLSGSNTPEPQVPKASPDEAAINLATSTSPKSLPPKPRPQTSTTLAPKDRTRDDLEANSQLKRLQQNLLALTNLNDDLSLHWHPPWCQQDDFNKTFWMLRNPPNVVTERLPNTIPQSKDHYTRCIRQDGDRPPLYVRTWDQWDWYCGCMECY